MGTHDEARLDVKFVDFMRRAGFDGWTSLWNTIYLVPEHIGNRGLIRHELMHLEQMRRDGKVRFMARYTWWLLRHGYQKNPHEIEARKAQANATPV